MGDRFAVTRLPTSRPCVARSRSAPGTPPPQPPPRTPDRGPAGGSDWLGFRKRGAYAVTVRFAPTSSPAQLAMAGALLARHPGLYMQTHLAENRAELDWVRTLFPEARSYLDVYARAGLLGARSVFAHGICRCFSALH